MYGVNYQMWHIPIQEHSGLDIQHLFFHSPARDSTLAYMYMLPKYTLRWRFFRRLGHHFDKNLHISEVRNPNKIEKLKVIAEKYNLDPSLFQSQAEKMLRCTFLLK